MRATRPSVPRVHIAFAPYGAGLVCALFYFECSCDVYGWCIGASGPDYHSAYLKLEDYFTAKETRFLATLGSDLYGGWRFLYSSKQPLLEERLAIDEDAAHELERVQDMFVREWLFFDDAPDAAAEQARYSRMELPVRKVNVRADGLNRLQDFGPDAQPVWQFRSPGFDNGVLEYLERHWPLDYGSFRKA